MNLTELAQVINSLRLSLVLKEDAEIGMGPLAEQEYLQALAFLDLARLAMAKAAIFRAQESR